MNPLTTKEGILSAIKQDPKLRFDKTLARNYLNAGGALSNGAIPLPVDENQVQTPTIQQTTTNMRTTANENGRKLDEKLATISGSYQSNVDTSGANVANTQPSGATFDEKTARTLFGNDFTGVQQNQDGTYTADESAIKRIKGVQSDEDLPPAEGTPERIAYDRDKGISEAMQVQDDRVNYANETLDRIALQADTATNALIQSIKTIYGARIKAMEASNKRLVGAETTYGFRTGRAKYTPTYQAGRISDVEQKGIDRVAELEGTMLQLIAKAEQARTDKDLEIFNDRMSELDDAYQDMRDEVQNLHTLAADRMKALRDAEKADIEAQQDVFDLQSDKAEASAAAVYSAIAGYDNTEDQIAFIKEYSKTSGIPVDTLFGAVEAYASDKAKADLDLKNIRSQISSRNANTQINADREARLNRPGTTEQQSKVGKYLSTDTGKRKLFGTGVDVTTADIDAIMSDPQTFFYVLSLAEEEEL